MGEANRRRNSGRAMMALRSGEAGRALRIWGVIALISLLAMPASLAVPCMVLSAVVLSILALGRAKRSGAQRRSRIIDELDRRGLELRSMTEHRWGGAIEFVADNGAGQQVRGALRGEHFSIDERKWVN